MSRHVLLIEDEPNIIEAIRFLLPPLRRMRGNTGALLHLSLAARCR